MTIEQLCRSGAADKRVDDRLAAVGVAGRRDRKLHERVVRVRSSRTLGAVDVDGEVAKTARFEVGPQRSLEPPGILVRHQAEVEFGSGGCGDDRFCSFIYIAGPNPADVTGRLEDRSREFTAFAARGEGGDAVFSPEFLFEVQPLEERLLAGRLPLDVVVKARDKDTFAFVFERYQRSDQAPGRVGQDVGRTGMRIPVQRFRGQLYVQFA